MNDRAIQWRRNKETHPAQGSSEILSLNMFRTKTGARRTWPSVVHKRKFHNRNTANYSNKRLRALVRYNLQNFTAKKLRCSPAAQTHAKAYEVSFFFLFVFFS